MTRTFNPESYDKLLAEYQPKTITTEALTEVIGSLEVALQIVNGDPTISIGFYDELGAGWSYQDAYHGGCDTIALQGIPEEDTPVFKNPKKKSN